MSNERVVVKFKQSWRGYSKGELAGFDPAQAKALVDGEVAELSKGGKATDKPAASKPSASKPVTGKAGEKPGSATAPAAGGDAGQDQSGGEGQDAGGTDQSGAGDDEPKP